jgi:hypothetical protein
LGVLSAGLLLTGARGLPPVPATFLEKLVAAHQAGRLNFFGDHTHLADARSFAAYLTPLRSAEWVVYSKRPFGGPEAVLAYLSRYTHRVTISSRLISLDERGVTFKWKDYRAEQCERQKIMTLATDEFIRRFLTHVLPKGLHRIRHYGLFTKSACADNVARARELLAVAKPEGPPPPPPIKPSRAVHAAAVEWSSSRSSSAVQRHDISPTAPTSVIRIDTS